MGTLVRQITSLSDAFYGVSVLNQDPPKTVQGASTKAIAIVGEFPWGPEDEVQSFTSIHELLAAVYPRAFGAIDTTTYFAMKALLGKKFPRDIKLVRVGATSAAKATKTFQDGESSPADSVIATATYKGSLGNLISIAWTANADTAANRDMTVKIGTTYEVTYENVVVDDTGSITVTDPGDPYVSVVADGSATDVPAVVGDTLLASGSDGTAVAGDYVGSISSDKGIRLFYGESVDVDVLFVAECPSGLVDTVNAGLKSYADDTGKGHAVLCSVPDQAASAVLAYHTTYKNTKGRTVYCWPRVKTLDTNDPDRTEITVDGNAFMACAMCGIDPWLSPGGAQSAQFFTGITGLANSSAAASTLETLREGGTACFFTDRALGTIIRDAVATDGQKIRTVRTRDWIGKSLSALLVNYAEAPLDLILASEELGPITGPELAAVKSWLEEQKGFSRIKAFSVDPWSQNTESTIDAGQWVILLLVETYSDQDKIILALTVGETVSIADAA